jgi:hypothetical protein
MPDAGDGKSELTLDREQSAAQKSPTGKGRAYELMHWI